MADTDMCLRLDLNKIRSKEYIKSPHAMRFFSRILVTHVASLMYSFAFVLKWQIYILCMCVMSICMYCVSCMPTCFALAISAFDYFALL